MKKTIFFNFDLSSNSFQNIGLTKKKNVRQIKAETRRSLFLVHLENLRNISVSMARDL